MLPLDVMLYAMRYHVKAASCEDDTNMQADLLRRAGLIAAAAAPYVHGRARLDEEEGKRVLEILIEDAAADGGVKRITASS